MADIASNNDLPGAAPVYTGPDIGAPLGSGASVSAVSWAAILAGAAGAAALSLILLVLGTGLGLSSASAFSSQGAGAATLGMAGIFWIIFTQLAASGLGGYLAGRLRTRWISVHTDEVYFRDTAHGFLAWAVASLVTAAFLASAVGTVVSAGTQATGAVVGGAATTAAAAAAGSARPGPTDVNGYFVDSLFRPDMNAAPTAAAPVAGGDAAAANTAITAASAMSTPSAPGTSTAAVQGNAATSAEVSRIMASALRGGTLPADDMHYVARLVSQRTGLAQADAEKRVTDVYAKAQAKLRDTEAAARDAAEKARKAAAHTALWLFISLLIGAFVASFAATFGGRQRDL